MAEAAEKLNWDRDYQKQSEELARLRALLTLNNIPFDSQPNEEKGASTAPANDQHLRGDTGLVDQP